MKIPTRLIMVLLLIFIVIFGCGGIFDSVHNFTNFLIVAGLVVLLGIVYVLEKAKKSK